MAIFAAATPAPQSSELEQRDEGSLEYAAFADAPK